MTPKRYNNYRKKGGSWIAFGVIALSILVVLLIFGRDYLESYLRRCDPGISYNNQIYGFKAATKLLNLQVDESNKAVTGVSNLLQIYIDQSKRLCEQYREGTLSGAEYDRRLADLGERFANLIYLQERKPADSILPEELPFYQETLNLLSPGVALPRSSFSYRVVAGNQIVRSDAMLRSGTKFYIEVDMPDRLYLYVVLLDSKNNVMRLYPTDLTGQDNPVQGKIRIPRDPQKSFKLDERQGVERILIFAESTRSTTIEDQIASVGRAGDVFSKNVAKALTEAARMRGLFVTSSNNSLDESGSAKVISRLGQPAIEFLIDHR